MKVYPYELKFISGQIKTYPCKCTPMHPGAISKKPPFCNIVNAHASDGSIDAKAAAANSPYGVALKPTHKPKR